MSKSSRHQSRFVAVQAVANYLFTNKTNALDPLLSVNKESRIDIDFTTHLYAQTLPHIDSWREILPTVIKAKTFSNLDMILQSLIFLGIYELVIDKLDIGIVINEYVTLTKRFFDDSEYKFIHGVLHEISTKKELFTASM